MKKILFPTDFSEVSNNAFIYALKLADNLNAEVLVLHVYNLPYMQSDLQNDGIPLNMMEVYDSIQLQNFENLKDQIPILRDIATQYDLTHVKMSHVLKQGELIWNINELVKEEGVEYIVMGTKGASGLKETFLGSTTASVIAEANVFVLGVPDTAEYKPIKNIVFTTRFREKDIKAMKKLIQLAKTFDAKIHCLYVKTSKSDVKEETIEDWKMLFSHENVKFHIVEHDNVKDTILIFTEVKNIDLLAMLTENRGFFEELFHQSLTQKVSYHVKIPILAIHENKL
ncbi:universal stress protein [Flavobacterium sp. '19STA2R22 D10 B1']|uniref:universal stress protein n=1 Tax=Flavobacterium aerium TaxID=3037261 RepID=UPI00278BFD00|nr:universal stress protein [Flavobacterium sp. '19STA2R22 D10 B1']